tara:strand:- start:1397 stop:1606 length:210 start_codon:yes stop_codon:yes gene_type:complete
MQQRLETLAEEFPQLETDYKEALDGIAILEEAGEIEAAKELRESAREAKARLDRWRATLTARGIIKKAK